MIGRWLTGFLVLVALAHGACAGTLEDPERFGPSASSSGSTPGCDAPALLTTSCAAGSGCHSTQDKVKDLDLQSPALADRLRDAKASSGALLVNPTKPEESVLYAKLTATPPFGARMPYGGSALDEASLKCVLSWVSQPQ